MPIIQSKRQINPLSINGNVSIGVAFPLDDVNLISGTQTVKEQVKTNAYEQFPEQFGGLNQY